MSADIIDFQTKKKLLTALTVEDEHYLDTLVYPEDLLAFILTLINDFTACLDEPAKDLSPEQVAQVETTFEIIDRIYAEFFEAA